MAAMPVRYRAAWIPGFNTDFDPEEAIRLGSAWLASRKSVRSRVVVMNAKKMMDNRPSLRELATRFPFVSPQSRDAGSAPRAVLAVYPTNTTLALAEALALDGALCVIPGTIDDVRSWIARSQATNLAFPEEAPPELPALSWVRDTLAPTEHEGFESGTRRCFMVDDLGTTAVATSSTCAPGRPFSAGLDRRSVGVTHAWRVVIAMRGCGRVGSNSLQAHTSSSDPRGATPR